MKWFDYKKISKPVYNIGFVNKSQLSIDSCISLKDINWVDTNGFEKSGWYADPFILKIEDNIITILAEKMDYKTQLGKIVWLDIDLNFNKVLSEIAILNIESHLSYPYIIRDDYKTYVMPENNISGKLTIYELDMHNKTLINPVVLIEEPLIDAQLMHLDNMYYLFGCRYSKDYTTTKEVEVYESNKLFGEYVYKQKLTSNTKDKRGAGAIYNDEEHGIIRPTQKCETCYGESVIFNKLSFKNNQLYETKIGEIKPHPLSKYPIQLHTYNAYSNIVVVDGCGSGSRIFHRIFNAISIIKKLIYKLRIY